MEIAVEAEGVLVPQLAQQIDLLALAASPVGELLVQRLVLDGVPADADTEPEPVAREHSQLGGLLGHQHGLALGEDDHGRGQLDRVGHGGDEAQQRERLVERDVLVVGAFESARPVAIGAQHMVVDEEVGDALGLQTLGVRSDRPRVGADLVVGQYGSDAHADDE